MRLIDADVLIDEIKKDTEKVIKQDDRVGSFWLGYIAGLVIKQPTIQPVATDTISKFIDGLEEIFADLRERHVDDSVCGLCEYDGAYIGQSGDWCNECPGFDRDDCFKLSDETRKKWTDEIIKALPPAQPEPHEGEWEQVSAQRYFMSASYFYRCSACGVNNVRNTNFCPHCGARMKGEI